MTFQQYIKQKNLDISIVDLQEVILSSRFDSEYFQLKFINLENNIRSKNYNTLESISDVNGGKRLPKGETFINDKNGVPYIRIVDIQGNFIDENNLEYISFELHKILNRYQIKNRDILVSIVGTLGLIGYNQLNLSKFNFTENCARLRTKLINPEYLLAVLISSIGQLQVDRERVGTNQPKLSLDRLRSFLIPISSLKFQKVVGDLVLESIKQKELSKELYLEAEKLLLSELGLENYRPTEQIISIKDSEEVELFGRVDAEFFQPKYDEIIEKVSNFNILELGEIVDYSKGIEPGSEAYQEDGVPFIRVADVSINGINKFEKYISNELVESFNGKYRAEKGDILFTKDGTIGITFVFDEDFETVLSSAFLKFKTKIEIENYYLALILNSIVCKLQIERFSGGALIEHLKPSDLMIIKVPILGKEIQKNITNLIIESKEKRILSKSLLEKSKKSVEIFIEEDEEKALDFLKQ